MWRPEGNMIAKAGLRKRLFKYISRRSGDHTCYLTEHTDTCIMHTFPLLNKKTWKISELVIARNSTVHIGDCFWTGFELYSSGAEFPAYSISNLAEEFSNWFQTGSSLKDSLRIELVRNCGLPAGFNWSWACPFLFSRVLKSAHQGLLKWFYKHDS